MVPIMASDNLSDPRGGSAPGALSVPLRWPRATTRRMMVLVAVVAVLIWAGREVPRIIDQTNACLARAETQALLARESRDNRRKILAQASILRAELDQRRHEVGSTDQLTDRYFASRWEFAAVDAQYLGEMAVYHVALEKIYRRAASFPWSKVPPEPSPPPDPLSSRTWKHEPGTVLVPISGGIAVAFTPDGAGLVVGCRDHTIKLLELPSRKVLATFPVPDDLAHSMVFSADRTTLIAVGWSAEGSYFVRRWDVANHHALPAIPWIDQSSGKPEPSITASAVASSPKGGTIAVGGGGSSPQGGTITVRGRRFPAKPPQQIHFVRLFDTRTGAMNWEYKGSGDWVNSVDFSPDGESLACANGAVLLLDARTGALKTTLKPVAGYVIAMAFSPDGRTLAGAGSNTVAMGGANGLGRVTLWDVPTGTILRTLQGPTRRAAAVAFSPDGRTVAAAGWGPVKVGRDTFTGAGASSNDSEVRLWDVATGRAVWTVEGDGHDACSLAFSPDGRSLAFCDYNYVYLVDAQTGKLKQIVMETTQRVRVPQPHTHKSRGATGGP